MKVVLSTSLAIIILIASLKDVAIIASFKIQQDRIAKTLCIERDVEESTCGGCCQLNKKLDEQHDDANAPQPTRERSINFDLTFVCNALNFSIINPFVFNSFSEFKTIIYHFRLSGALFRPPKI